MVSSGAVTGGVANALATDRAGNVYVAGYGANATWL